MISFLRRHPKALSFTISVLTCVNRRFLSFLNWSMLMLINLKGLDPNPPPPPPPASEPTPEDIWAKEHPHFVRRWLQPHYVPEWVVKSFRDLKEHAINKNRASRKPLATMQNTYPDKVDSPLEVSGESTKPDNQ